MPQEIIVTVFGSSRPGEGSPDYEEACVLGRALAKHGFAVCSGGYGGVMEAVSRGAKQVGGKTYGVTAEFFKSAKLNRWIDVEVRKQTWEERLFELIRIAFNGLEFVIHLPCSAGVDPFPQLFYHREHCLSSLIEQLDLLLKSVSTQIFWADQNAFADFLHRFRYLIKSSR